MNDKIIIGVLLTIIMLVVVNVNSAYATSVDETIKNGENFIETGKQQQTNGSSGDRKSVV